MERVMIDQVVKERGSVTKPARLNSASRGSSAVEVVEEEINLGRPASAIRSIPSGGLPANKLLAAWPSEDFARLLPHMERVSLSACEYVYGFGNRVDSIYFPETAVISQIQLLEDGNTTEVALVGNEGMVGLMAVFGAPPANYWSQVIVAGHALRIRAELILEEFHRNQSVQRLVLGYTGKRIAQLSQRAVCNGRHTLSGRLCSWLLMVQERACAGHLMLTHEEIARHLGARRASISVTATLLRDKGIIGYNRGHVRILDREGLLASACECYRTLAC
jgi:CRP-like cAMP-binding protein